MNWLVFTFVLTTLSGCYNHTYKYFEFSSDTTTDELGVTVGLLGEFTQMSETPRVTHKGSPYTLVISYHSEREEQSPVAIENIKILTAHGQTVFSSAGVKLNAVWSEYFDNWTTHWSIKGLDVEHVPLKVEFDYKFNGQEAPTSESFEARLQPVFKEERRNDGLDGIMSV